MKQFKIGDPVEAKRAIYPYSESLPSIVWLAATVVSNDSGGLGVAFADGKRLMLPHHAGLYREPEAVGPYADIGGDWGGRP